MMHLGLQDKNIAGVANAVSRPLVYDVGMKNGDDAAYYLRKGFDVVVGESLVEPIVCRTQ